MRMIIKFLMAVIVFSVMSVNAYAVDYYNGESLGVCSYVDRYDSQAINLLAFYGWNLNGATVYVVDYSSSYYAVRTLVVGYKEAHSNNGTINGNQVGTQTDYILCPTDYLANGTGAVASPYFPGYFYAGRIHTWLLPKSYFNLGQNFFSATVDGRSANMTITLQ